MMYEYDGYQTTRLDVREGERVTLANFVAEITRETRHIDGRSQVTILRIEGKMPNPDKDKQDEPIILPPIEINAVDFPSLAWILPHWGVQAILHPESGVKDHMRTAIQMRSNPVKKTVYRHTGWTTINGVRTYLHGGGGMSHKGNDPSIEVSLPPELSRYNLCTECEDTVEAIRAGFRLLSLSRPEVTWPLIAATVTPMFAPCDFAMHITGRTGTYKSELSSLFQSWYGNQMDARHLPGSWSSTANALEAQAFYCKDAVFAIDDFVPSGTAWQQRAYHATADKIVRAQGNQSGRARLTDTSNLQTSMYPRGLVLSTGEDTPEGHSVRGRMLILELSPGDVDLPTLSACQKDRPLYPAIIAGLAKHLSREGVDIRKRAEEIRNSNLDIGHSRTPSMLGKLIAGCEAYIEWCEAQGALTPKEAKNYKKQASNSILAAGREQKRHLEATDPAELWVVAIRQVLGQGLGHLRTLSGNIPLGAAAVGYTVERASGEMPTFKARGPTIGWIDWDDNEIYLDITAGYPVVRKAAGSEFALSKATILKRLKEAGIITRVNDAQQRNTVRITVGGVQRQVMVMGAKEILELTEIPTER